MLPWIGKGEAGRELLEPYKSKKSIPWWDAFFPFLI